MKVEDIIAKLRAMTIWYAENKVWENPPLLPSHLGEYEAYAGLLSSHYAEFIARYRDAESKVYSEEMEAKAKHDAKATRPSELRSMAEVDNRIMVRMASVKGQRERLEAEMKAANTHITVCQSLNRRQSDEAKGIL